MVPFGCGCPFDHQRQAPAVRCVRERGGGPRSSSSTVLQRRVPTVQTVQKTDEIPQLQSLDKVDDTRCCTTTGAWVDRAENCGRFRSCTALTRWTMSLLCRSSSWSLWRCHRFSLSPELWKQCGDEGFFLAIFRAPPGCPGDERSPR